MYIYACEDMYLYVYMLIDRQNWLQVTHDTRVLKSHKRKMSVICMQ